MSLKTLEEKWKKEKKKPLSREALQWFLDNTKKHLKAASISEARTLGKTSAFPIPGRIYVYSYDPKWKDKLPYYDILPLVLITSIDTSKKRWIGINFHYLPPIVRMRIMTELLKTIEGKGTDIQKLKLNYAKARALAAGIGSSIPLKNSIKMYLASHAVTKLIEVSHDNWDMSLFLPLAKFKKSTPF